MKDRTGKEHGLDVSLTDFRRRTLYYLDRAYETKEPLYIFRRKKLVGIVWKAYGPQRVKSKLEYLNFYLSALELEWASKGLDLRAALGLPPAVNEESATKEQPAQGGPRRNSKEQP